MSAKAAAVARLEDDEDIGAEAQSLQAAMAGVNISKSPPTSVPKVERCPFKSIKLNWQPGQGGHRPNADTARLLAEAGGPSVIHDFTERFYKKSFADPHIDKFIRDRSDPHGQRFANWIVEKFGAGTPWTEERATRKTCPFSSHGYEFETPHDRSSAHFAAWHSPKREPEKFGQHFKLSDCRVWMRLHFWALRETEAWNKSPSFVDYYIKFIGHFVSVYERTATMFARDSARWSADEENIRRYIANGNRMEPEVFTSSLQEAVAALPPDERGEARAGQGQWPYYH